MSNYVLIHGSFQGGWIWKPTAKLLASRGHEVYCPTLDGCGERASAIRSGITVTTQAKEISSFLFYQDLNDVILVATSTGGLVLCKVAELSRDRVKKVVFIDALAPQPGERVDEIVKLDTNSNQIRTDLTKGPSKDDLEQIPQYIDSSEVFTFVPTDSTMDSIYIYNDYVNENSEYKFNEFANLASTYGDEVSYLESAGPANNIQVTI